MFESLRNERMIEEREDYENMFFSKEDIMKSEEFDLMVFKYECDYDDYLDDVSFEVKIDEDFLLEEDALHLRDESLIKSRIAYEVGNSPIDEMVEEDTLDLIIASYDENMYFDYPDYPDFDFYDDYLEYPCYDEYDMDAAYCGHEMFGYVVSDDPFDSLEGCDYPEGPNENIEGFKYPEIEYYDDFTFNVDYPEPEMSFEECYDDFTADFELKISIDEYYEDLITSFEFGSGQFDLSFPDRDDGQMMKMIDEHIRELDLLLESEVGDEHFLPSTDGDIIFC